VGERKSHEAALSELDGSQAAKGAAGELNKRAMKGRGDFPRKLDVSPVIMTKKNGF